MIRDRDRIYVRSSQHDRLRAMGIRDTYRTRPHPGSMALRTAGLVGSLRRESGRSYYCLGEVLGRILKATRPLLQRVTSSVL